MAKVRINNIDSVTHDAVQIEGAQEMSHDTQFGTKGSQSDGEPPTFDITSFAVTGEVVFDNLAAYNQALGGDQSNLVVTSVSEGLGARTITIKNVKFMASSASVPHADTSSRARYRARFLASPGASDTPATMITDA